MGMVKKIMALSLSFTIMASFGAFLGMGATPGNVNITYYGGTGGASAVNVINDLNTDTKRYSDDTCEFDVLPEMLAGATYIQGANADSALSAYATTRGRWLEFTIDKPATLYYISTSTYLNDPNGQAYIYLWLTEPDSGWVKQDGLLSAVNSDAHKWEVNTDSNAKKKDAYLFKREISVPKGGTAEVVIPAIGSHCGNLPYAVALQWKDEEAPLPSLGTVTLDYYGGGNTSGLQVINKMAVGTPRFADDDCKFEIIPPQLTGATYIGTKYLDYNHTGYLTNSARWLEFTINKSASIYYLSASTYVGTSCQGYISTWLTEPNSGWVKADGSLTSTPGDAKKWQININSTATKRDVYLFKRELIVPAGQTLEVKIPAIGSGGSGGYVYSAALQWKDESLNLSAIKVNGLTITGFDDSLDAYTLYNIRENAQITADVNDEGTQVAVTKPAASDGILTGEGKITLTAASGDKRVITLSFVKPEDAVPTARLIGQGGLFSYNIVDNLQLNSTKVYVDRDTVFTSFGEYDFEGCSYIQTAQNDYNNSENAGAAYRDWLSFTINQSAEIYIATLYKYSGNHLPWLNPDYGSYWGATLVSEINKITDDYGSGSQRDSFLYKKTVHVAAGKTEEITLGNLGPYGAKMYTVIIKWIDTELPANIPASEIPVYQGVDETFTNGEGETVTASNAIVFGKAKDAYGDMVRVDYGVLLSEEFITLEQFTIDNLDIIKVAGDQSNPESLPNVAGFYGVRFYGTGITAGRAYYAVPYAVYEDSSGATEVIYGDDIKVIQIK